jgi:hypothetical protein
MLTWLTVAGLMKARRYAAGRTQIVENRRNGGWLHKRVLKGSESPTIHP